MLFALRASGRVAGFGPARLWFFRIPVARCVPVYVRLRAGRVLLSELRAAWTRIPAGRRTETACNGQLRVREGRSRTRSLQWLPVSRVRSPGRRTAAAMPQKPLPQPTPQRGPRELASGISAGGRERRWGGRALRRGGCRWGPKRIRLARRRPAVPVAPPTRLRRKP